MANTYTEYKNKKRGESDMGVKMPFTKHEAAVLLYFFLKFKRGDMKRKDAIAKCSRFLRQFAVVRGIEIDEIFRNEIGIKDQMVYMENAYYKKNKTSALFIDIVKMFKTDRENFNHLIAEASATVRNAREMMKSKMSINDKPMAEQTVNIVDILPILSDAGLNGLKAEEIALEANLSVSVVKQLASENYDIIELNERFIHKNAITDFDEGAEGLKQILSTLTEKNGIVSAAQLYDYAKAKLSMFIEDNDLDSRQVYDLAKHLFSKEHYDGVQYNFQRNQYISKTDASVNNRWDILKSFAQNRDIYFKQEDVEEYFKRLGVTLPNLYGEMRSGGNKIFLYDTETFILADSIGMDTEWLEHLHKCFHKLFDDMTDHIIFRVIDESWYEFLPSLPEGKPWTPIFLQNVILQCEKQVGVRLIRPLSSQFLDTLASMIVTLDSDIETFPEAVLTFLYDEGLKIQQCEADELRRLLLNFEVIGNELNTNQLYRATKDDRHFVWDRSKKNVNIRWEAM